MQTSQADFFVIPVGTWQLFDGIFLWGFDSTVYSPDTWKDCNFDILLTLTAKHALICIGLDIHSGNCNLRM